MTTDELTERLVEAWPMIRAKLPDGSSEPNAVRKVEMPKLGGGTRMLGIPTAVDRFVQRSLTAALFRSSHASIACEDAPVVRSPAHRPSSESRENAGDERGMDRLRR